MQHDIHTLSPDDRRDELTSLFAAALIRLHARDALPGALDEPGLSAAPVTVVGKCDLALSFVATYPFMDTRVSDDSDLRPQQENQP